MILEQDPNPYKKKVVFRTIVTKLKLAFVLYRNTFFELFKILADFCHIRVESQICIRIMENDISIDKILNR